MFGRIVPSGVQIAAATCDGEPSAALSRAELGRILMNLVVNAGDAMPRGGHITIGTAIQPASEWQLGVAEVVVVSVTDDGTGIAAETMPHVFEPFFTTKHEGRGTGLGLSVVRATVEAAGGAVRIESQLGRGTCISIALLRRPPATAPIPTPRRGAGRHERVLLVEDESLVLRTTRHVLERNGYDVLGIGQPSRVLELDEATLARLDVVVTDMEMSGLSGPALIERLRERCPDLPAILVTGSAQLLASAEVPARTTILQKPWTHDDLLGALRRTLEPGDPS
jgi:CheY-like chemotaxis protein